MKKIAMIGAGALATVLALSAVAPTFAEEGASSSSVPSSAVSSSSVKPPKKGKVTLDTACMGAAATKRDAAISAALQTVVTAIQTRGAAETAAWTANDKTAMKAAKTAFSGTWKTFNLARKTAWNQYKTDAKACHGTPQTPDPSGI